MPGNRDLALNTINWLAQQENLIAIRPRQPEERRITVTAAQQFNLWLLTFVLDPGGHHRGRRGRLVEEARVRRARSTLVMLVVLVALGAYIYFVEPGASPGVGEPRRTRSLFAVESGDIRTLVIATADGETTLARDGADADWRITGPVAGAGGHAPAVVTADRSHVGHGQPGDRRGSGRRSRPVRSGRARGEPGVRHPRPTATRSGSCSGSQTPLGTNRYAKLDDADRVFLVPSRLDGVFRKTTFDLRDKTVLEVDTVDVDAFEIQLETERLAFAKADNEWRLTEPWEVRADFSTVEGLVGRVANGQMRSVESEDVDGDAGRRARTPTTTPTASRRRPSPRSWGPGARAPRWWSEARPRRDRRYARDLARPLVFTVDTSLVTDLERNAGEYRRKDLFTFRSFNASRLEIEQDGVTTVLESRPAIGDADTADAGEEVWTRVSPDPADLDRNDVMDLLSQVSNLRADSFVVVTDGRRARRRPGAGHRAGHLRRRRCRRRRWSCGDSTARPMASLTTSRARR